MRLVRRVLPLLLTVLGLVAGLAPGRAQEPPAAPGIAPDGGQGEYLAHAADCVACHTAPGGAPYAGGRGMASPLGTIYATNITPDPLTGIGNYSLADFERAIRRGIARDGHHLYPSMPYPSYAKISDADVAALYGFFMKSVQPVVRQNTANDIHWLLSIRWPLAIWNWLFTEPDPFRPAADHDAQWNRGAYLVEGLGHCGACHTPRGLLFQERALSDTGPKFLAGAVLDNWSATDLRGDPLQGLGRWSEAQIAQFLKTGHNAGATAFGSMIDVINYSTQYLDDGDVAAMAHYLKSLSPGSGPQTSWSYDEGSARALSALQFQAPGARTYVNLCAGCHGQDGRGGAPFIPPLAGNAAVLDPDPVSLVNITLNGSSPVVVGGRPDVYRMVSFRQVLDDQQLAEVVSFVRSAWGNRASAVDPRQVGEVRNHTSAVRYYELDLLRMR